MQVLAGTGIGTLVFQRQLAAQVAAGVTVNSEMLAQAEWVAGIALSERERESVSEALTRMQRDLAELRAVPIDYRVGPAFRFAPRELEMDAKATAAEGAALPAAAEAVRRPDSDEDLAFLPVTALAALVRTRQVTAMELTRLYLSRLQSHDPTLRCVVTLTEALALRQAARADEEIAAGNYRGPLHGIPWGAKDLIAYPGYPTSWGAARYREQQLDHKATVAEKLDAAGAVLVAKLSLGSLAEGDRWFGGMTRNPFFPEQGSSGSSAGSAAAVAAGLVGFALGSETLGSIVSPCVRCRTSGLRPTFGRVSRAGCMPLSWTMDKIGPIARSVEDCALVFDAIHGADDGDPASVSRDFRWPFPGTVAGMRVGHFEGESADVLDRLRAMGVKLEKIDLPGREMAGRLSYILSVEAAAAFDEVTAGGLTEGDGFNLWQERFQRMRFVSAVDYLRALRLRSVLMDQVARATGNVDAWVGGDDLFITNLTGHPTVVMPHGPWEVVEDDGARRFRSRSVTFSGQPFTDAALLALGTAFQNSGDAHRLRPPL